MSKVVYWAVLVVLVLGLIGLVNSEYHIPIDAQFALFWSDPVGGTTLTYRSAGLVSGVVKYREASGSVVGQTEIGYFIASSEGTVSRYASRDNWASEVEGRFPGLDIELIAPSRLADPVWTLIALAALMALIIWITFGFWTAWRPSRSSTTC